MANIVSGCDFNLGEIRDADSYIYDGGRRASRRLRLKFEMEVDYRKTEIRHNMTTAEASTSSPSSSSSPTSPMSSSPTPSSSASTKTTSLSIPTSTASPSQLPNGATKVQDANSLTYSCRNSFRADLPRQSHAVSKSSISKLKTQKLQSPTKKKRAERRHRSLSESSWYSCSSSCSSKDSGSSLKHLTPASNIVSKVAKSEDKSKSAKDAKDTTKDHESKKENDPVISAHTLVEGLLLDLLPAVVQQKSTDISDPATASDDDNNDSAFSTDTERSDDAKKEEEEEKKRSDLLDRILEMANKVLQRLDRLQSIK